MKFKDKKEYYSLRKFKGVGLASAVVGLALLTPSVMAEEHMLNIENKNVDTTLSVVENDMTPNKPIDKDVSKHMGHLKLTFQLLLIMLVKTLWEGVTLKMK